MNNEIEVFEYLDNRARIEGININDLQNLFLAPGPASSRIYKNYHMKMCQKEVLLLHDGNVNEKKFIKCVKYYYDMKETDCYRIRLKLEAYNDMQDNEACMKCHLKCIDKIKTNEF